MKRDKVIENLYGRFILPIKKPRDKFIGIEIEMPVVNLDNKPTDQKLAQKVFNEFVEHFGFTPIAYDDNGICYSATLEENEDNISFDCSYNNLELSLGKEKSLFPLHNRFKEYVTFLNNHLSKENHLVTGLGINPNFQINNQEYIPSERYRMLEGYLAKAQEWEYPMYFHPYYGYGTFSSASQVQLDFFEDELLDGLKAFSLVEPIKALLFANSILETEPEYNCVRDLLWENSTHGINPHNIGMYENELSDLNELLEYMATMSIFNVNRDNHSIYFKPIPIREYFNKESITGIYYDKGEYKEREFKPDKEDILYFRTYKFEDLTFRGTIEFRSSCNQPFSDSMSVAAFHVGLKRKMNELLELLENDRVLYRHGYSASELRKLLNKTELPDFVDKESLKELTKQVLDIAKEGLLERGYGEEIFLEPLYKRASTLTSPSKYYRENIEDLNKVIKRFSKFDEENILEI